MGLDPKVLSRGENDVAVTPIDRKRCRQDRHGTNETALSRLMTRLTQERFVRLGLMFKERCADTHLKELVVERADDQRRITVGGRQLYSFGSDSFLGLDRDPRVQQALIQAVRPWGTHNGASRMFSTVELCEEAERRLAKWLGVEDTLIFASVTLANAGLIPAVAGEGDLLVVDRLSHDSIHQAAKIAAENGAIYKQLHPCRRETLAGILTKERYRGCVVAVDGVNSMSGTIPPLKELDEVTRGFGGILYVDDAHGTGVVGPRGRGAAAKVLGSLDDVLMVGSLSKAFSCMGAFVTCTTTLKQVLKMKSNTFIFGGPVPPPYLAAICAVCDIIDAPEYDELLGRLHMRRIQNLPGSKELFVGLAWAVTTALVPALAGGVLSQLWQGAAVAVAFAFLMAFQRTLLTDLRDVEGDQLVGRETLARVLGESRCKRLLMWLLAGEAALLAGSGLAGWTSAVSFFLLIPVAYGAVCQRLYHRGHLPPTELGEALIDGKFYLIGLLGFWWGML